MTSFRQDVAQNAQSNELETEEAPEAEREGGVDGEARSWITILTAETQNDAKAVIVECLQAVLILYAQ